MIERRLISGGMRNCATALQIREIVDRLILEPQLEIHILTSTPATSEQMIREIKHRLAGFGQHQPKLYATVLE